MSASAWRSAVLFGMALLLTTPNAASSQTPLAANHGAVDPRAGLKPGFDDAGVALKGLEIVASVPTPPGFTAVAGTADPEIGRFASGIVSDQTYEIAIMKNLLRIGGQGTR